MGFLIREAIRACDGKSARTAPRWGRRFALSFCFLLLAFCAAITPRPARAADPAEAALPPYTIAVFTSSRPDSCFDNGDIGAIAALTKQTLAEINRSGSFQGRALSLKFLDDKGSADRALSNMRDALADPMIVSMIGLSNSARAKAVFDRHGKDISASGIPFLSNISVAALFKDAPNVFSTQVSQDEERVPVMVEFIRTMGYERIAFVGLSDNIVSKALSDGLKKGLGSGALVADLALRPTERLLEKADIEMAVSELSSKSPDLIVLGIGATRGKDLLAALSAARVTPALFISGRIESLDEAAVGKYPNPIYQLAWNRLPDADNDRLRRLISRDPEESWIFEGRKNPEAKGWATGECKARPDAKAADPFDSANQRAIGIGTQYADMVSLTASTLRSVPLGADLPSIRRHIVKKIGNSYAAGRGVFKNGFDGWSFHADSRTAARTPFVVIKPQTIDFTQLAPIQFVRLKDGALRQVNTLYLDVDLIRANRIEDSEKTFFAEFYLSLRTNSASGIEEIDFTNAVLDPRTNGRQLTIETLHDGGINAAYPAAMKIYKVTGRFTFEPELTRYPFDTQRFAIELQPKRADRPFVVQPPPPSLRDQSVATDGWTLKSQFVGYGEDVVPLLDAYTHEPSVVPFYKASFVWMMKRQTTDYLFRVVIPLGFILVVAYFSYFISTAHFEAIVTIQVTALLSAVALYLSLPKLDADDATLSDRLFVFNYMMVSLMIAISVLRVNGFVKGSQPAKALLGVLHVVGMPLMVGSMMYFVSRILEQ